jgi:hypothetical protein
MQEYCARVRFHPPLAAEPPTALARSADPQAGTTSKRRKSAAAAAGDDAAAAAAAALAAKGYEAHVDGNVIDLTPGFRCAAVCCSREGALCTALAHPWQAALLCRDCGPPLS